jgi:hypothetical protein
VNSPTADKLAGPHRFKSLGVRTRFVESRLEATHPYADDDPYGEFKRRYASTTRSLTEMPGMTVGADTVARAALRAGEAKSPKPRYIVGVSRKPSCSAGCC